MITAFIQDKPALERGLFDDETLPEELNQLRMGKIVKDKYPDLDEEDQEAVRQHAVATLNLTQKAKQLAAGGDKLADDGDKPGNTALIDGVRQFTMDVRDLDIDLIDHINPFGEAYAILAKAMNEESLKQVAAVIAAKRINLSREEARELAKRALNKDPAGRRIVETAAGPLFSSQADDDDLASGTIYVLRSRSDQPLVAENRELVHKIGVTGGSVEKRIANASNDATFLLADVEVVASYELFNINRSKLEKLIHRFFEPARLDIQINDRFGKPVVPREWFLVPLFVIDEMVGRIKDGTIGDYYYDTESASLKPC